ncbi:cytochrome d ubiquinol oxidase subunit II [Sporolactobacillus spathodeae]|uniref:Cytochrome d ubiquinol oxidase subunit II n=1 Tax=Sporolactobacillus spathodeae TaxID=1465502 RepID=A0ABS2Q4Q7_9BACL|nr:cytochrome d ubiquinol oxidase subunit II [Sporolactobacillus spathodeae]MBM7656751.1 cytochrome d ubiquinol oxidase subunit II [Sporolactobacillus spathodeae]
MNDSLIFMLLWILVYTYMMLASIDFGAGFYLFYGQVFLKKDSLFTPIHDYLSPLSELINIGFILLFAVICGLSPDIALMYQSTLAVPGVLAIILILIKGTFFAMAELTQRKSPLNQLCVAVNGIAGMLILPALSIAMVISEGGFNAGRGNWFALGKQLLTDFYFWTVMIIAVVSILYISAMYFVSFSHSNGKDELSSGMRNFALFWSMPTVLASGLTFLGLENQNPDHFMKTLDHSWMFLLSLLCLLLAVTLVFIKHAYRLSFFVVMMQYYFALMGYTQSHAPYIIFPDIKMPVGTSAKLHTGWYLTLIFILSLSVPIFVILLKDRIIRKKMQFKQSLN